MDHFVVGCIIENINNPCLVYTILRPPGEVVHVQPQVSVLLVASLHSDCVCSGGHLSIESRVSRLVFSLLVVGLSLALCLVVFVPVIPKNAHGIKTVLGSLFCSIDLYVCFYASTMMF